MEKLKIKPLNSFPDFNGYTFLMPSVSVGNVGQLAIDVIISTLKPTKVAIVHHAALLPLVGYDPYYSKSAEITTAADLHLCDSRKLLILQIRSPLISEEKRSFLEHLSSWIKEKSFKQVVVLSSCHAHLRHDSQLTGSQFRYLANSIQRPNISWLNEIGIHELEEKEDAFGVKQKHVAGAGFVYDFLDICQVPAVTLMKFVDEGNNTMDAFALVSFLNSWTKYQETDNWEVPFSWKNLFGAAPPPLLY